MKKCVALLLCWLLHAVAIAQTDSCPWQFAGGIAPKILNPQMTTDTAPLCYTSYAIMYSGVSRTPLWSAEHLRETAGVAHHGPKRRNAFHAEPRLPRSMRAELRDYAHSGFDRGHMTPSGDMPTPQAQYESFSLANMVPQNPESNQQLWEGIEESTRALAASEGELYIVTGPIFEGRSLERLNGRVLVPTRLFKAVYDPVAGKAAAYIAPNAPGFKYETVSLGELERLTGIRAFPALQKEGLAISALNLPEPMPHGRRMRASRNGTRSEGR